MRRLTVGLALPTQSLFLHHRDPGPVHLHMQDGNRFPGDDRQIQLQSFLDLRLARAGRYRLRWPRRYAPQIWWSPPNRLVASSAPDPDRREPLGPPEHACGAPREKTPYFRYPVRHPPETGPRDTGSTNSRDGPCAPDRRWSGWVCSGFPGIGRDGRRSTATDADPPPGFRIAAVRLRRWSRLGGERFARPTRPLPDRSGPPSGVGQRYG